jgi:hypothetical protein
MTMPRYHVTVERTMRDVLTVEADDEDDAAERAETMFCELHGEHDYDDTFSWVENADDDAELSVEQ